MLAFLAAALAGASPTPILETTMPWWERITVTVDDKGQQQSCRYQTSESHEAACDAAIAASIKAGSKGGNGRYSKVTFERRFSPGGRIDGGSLQPGDTLLGRQVMFLTFDADGALDSCKVVATSGEFRPDYDCEEARKERFAAAASAQPGARQAFLTVLAYGHTENIA